MPIIFKELKLNIMSSQNFKLCSVILKQVFGELVERVGNCLLQSPSQTLKGIIKSTKLSYAEAFAAVSILIKFGLVELFKSQTSDTLVEYVIVKEKILFFLKYSKFVYHIQTKFGNVAASIIEELLRLGCERTSNLLIKCFIIAETRDNLANYKNMFKTLVNERYIIRQPCILQIANENTIVPILKMEEKLQFQTPDIDLTVLQEKLSSQNNDKCMNEPSWSVNFLKFHQDFRDSLIISAIGNKLGNGPADCFKLILKIMYNNTEAWTKNCSNPITLAEIKQNMQRNNSDFTKQVENYVVLISEDSLGFLRKTGDTGGGQYVIDFKKGFKRLTLVCVENVINEKFGSKAARIFRVISQKQFVEQEEIQKEAMIPSKEAKLLTYNLFQEHFIQIKTLRKQGGGGSCPNKSYFLFYVSLTPVVYMLLNHCQKTLCNTISRSVHEKIVNKRLIDKSQKLESIIETIKDRGESEEYISEILETLTPAERDVLQKVKNHIKILSAAELKLDNTIFLLQLYQYHICKN